MGVVLFIGAVLAAFFSGWFYGRCTPSWEEDSAREGAPDMGMDTLYGSHIDLSGSFEGSNSDIPASIARTRTSFRTGIWLPSVLTVATLVFAFFSFSGFGPDWWGRWWLWILIGLAAAGYILSRLTDHGPMGPLE